MLVLIGKFENLALKILQKYIKKNKQTKQKNSTRKNKTKQKAKKIKQKKAKWKTVRE